MPKHHHQSKAEQIYNKTHGTASFHHEKMPYQSSELIKAEAIQKESAEEDGSIQSGAFEVYREKE